MPPPITPPQSNLDEIRNLLSALPDKNTGAGTSARLTLDARGQSNSWGVYGDLVNWFYAHSPDKTKTINRPRLMIFSATQGTTVAHLNPNATEQTQKILATFVNGTAPAHTLCQTTDTELRVYEMDLNTPTADITTAPALDPNAGTQAMAYGMMGVEQGVDLVCLSDLALGNDINTSAVAMALLGGTATDWSTTPDHTPLLQTLTPLPDNADPLDILVQYGGLELCAMAGAILACRMGRVPVILDSFGATVTALALETVRAGATSHCVVSAPHHGIHQNIIQHLNAPTISPEKHPYATGVSSLMAVAPLRAFVQMAG